jgi:PPOX class probable FMN-dependent enzyme
MKNSVRDPNRIETAEQLRDRMGQPSQFVSQKVNDFVDEFSRAFIAGSPFVVLSTSNARGQMDASPKGDVPGFVEVFDDKTVLIPDRKGNKLLYGLENILENPNVGLLFLVPGTEETLRINGRAELTEDPEILARLAARGQDALLAIRVTVDECFFHCAKAFRRSSLWKPETWNPQKVSMGAMFARKLDRDDDKELIENIDAALEKDYREEL